MDAERLIHQMKRDHDRVLKEITALEEALGTGAGVPADSIPEIRALLDLLEEQFRTHMMAEDEVLYPALMRALPASMGSVEPLHDEHGELRLMLERLCVTFSEPPGKARDEQIAVQVHDLADLLRIHLRKEESLVFGVAARLLSADVIESVMTRMTTAAPANRPATDLTRTKGTSQ